jgi:hypothetical protein
LKQHAKHVAVGGVVTPATLGLVTVIANAIQEAVGLNLSGIGLAIYLAAFLIGSALVLHGQLRLEAQKVLAELGSGELDLGGIIGGLSGLFDPPKEPAAAAPPAPVVAPTTVVVPPPPPPPDAP